MSFVPEEIGLSFHAFKKSIGGDRPIDFICVLEEESYYCLRGFVEPGTDFVGLKHGKECVRVKSESRTQELAKELGSTVFIDGDTDRVLVAGIYFLNYPEDMCVGLQEVAAGFNAVLQTSDTCKGVEGRVVGNTAVDVEGVDKSRIGGTFGDVDAHGLANAQSLFAHQKESASNHKEEEGGDGDENDVSAFHIDDGLIEDELITEGIDITVGTDNPVAEGGAMLVSGMLEDVQAWRVVCSNVGIDLVKRGILAAKICEGLNHGGTMAFMAVFVGDDNSYCGTAVDGVVIV